MKERRILFVLVLACALTLTSVAAANVGVPMIAIVYPGMGVMLIPVIALEILVLRRRLVQPLKKSVIAVTVSNLVSTVIGVPLTWAALVALQVGTGLVEEKLETGIDLLLSFDTFAGKLFAVTGQAAWLTPYEADMYWMIPVATLALLVPFFFASWFSEYYITRLFMRDVDHFELKRAVLVANLASYALLAGVTLIGLGASIYQRGGI